MDKKLRERLSFTNPRHLLALGFGSGLMPFMPGTFGTLVGIPIVFLSSFCQPIWLLALAILCGVIGVRICGQTATDMGVHDHGSIVWDEIVGIMITFLWVPLCWQTLLLGFALFRLFDIVKPWPIGFIDKKLSGGLGIMLDDIIAGVMACVCLHLLLPKLLPNCLGFL